MPNDPLTGHRVHRWRFDLLDNSDRLLGAFRRVQKNSLQLDYDTAATIRCSGNLTVIGGGVDWSQRRLRAWYDVDGLDPIPMITAVVSAPDEQHVSGRIEVPISLLDKTSILDETGPGVAFGLAGGSAILASVRSIIALTGDSSAVLLAPDTDQVLAAAMSWDANTSWLAIINDLLPAGNFTPLWADGLGRFRTDVYLAPASRPIAWTFGGGPTNVYLPDWTRSSDWYGVPNRYVCVASTDGTSAAATATATDTNPASPFSYPIRGRWITRTETGVDAAVGQLAAICQAKLTQAQQVAATIAFQHPILPGVGLDSRVVFANRNLDEAVSATVEKMSVRAGQSVQSQIRRIP